MSYDLYFKARNGGFDESAFVQYFSQRPLYKCEGRQAWYGNEDTGVYFLFELQDEAEATSDEEAIYPVALNINYFRPSYFVQEAEPEVTNFVKHFDLLVMDPQMNGMGEGEYKADSLISGWKHGNEFGYSSILSNPDNYAEIFHMPTEKLEEVWRWNHGRSALQQQVGESKFVPRIMFLKFGEETITAAVWPDGIPVIAPRVDYLCVPREDLAPKKFFRKQKDTTFVSWSDAQKVLLANGTLNEDGSITCNYDSPPSEIAKFISGLPRDARTVAAVSPDKILNREMFELYATW